MGTIKGKWISTQTTPKPTKDGFYNVEDSVGVKGIAEYKNSHWFSESGNPVSKWWMEGELYISMTSPYKVISHYPNSPYKIGDYVKFSDTGETFLCTKTPVREWGEIGYSENWENVDELEWYPNIFLNVLVVPKNNELDINHTDTTEDNLRVICIDFVEYVYKNWSYVGKKKKYRCRGDFYRNHDLLDILYVYNLFRQSL